jgi:hypothetical protein
MVIPTESNDPHYRPKSEMVSYSVLQWIKRYSVWCGRVNLGT